MALRRVCTVGLFLWDGSEGPAAGLRGRGGGRGRAGGALRSGSRNLLSLASPPSSRPPLPHFLPGIRVRMVPLVPDVNPILLPSGLEHTAVTDRNPVSQEHKGARHTCLCHAGVRPQGHANQPCPATHGSQLLPPPAPPAPGALMLRRLAPSFSLRESPFLNPKPCSAETPPTSCHPTPLPQETTPDP